MASYWTVPMKYEFQVPGWVVLLTTSREGAFASISELQRIVYSNNYCIGRSFDAARHLSNS